MRMAVCLAVVALLVVLAGCSSSGPSSVSAAGDQGAERASPLQRRPISTRSPTRNPLHLVVLGDPAPLRSLCFGCTGFADRYAARLQDETGRPVDLANRSRVHGMGHADIRREVTGDDTARARLRTADVVIVSMPSGPGAEAALAPIADAAPGRARCWH